MKVNPFTIPKTGNQNLIVQVDQGPRFYDRLHSHEEIQISLITKGCGKLIVANRVHSFDEGSLFVIPGNLPHLFQSREDLAESRMITLFFTPTSFLPGFFEIPELSQVHRFVTEVGLGWRLSPPVSDAGRIMEALPTATVSQRFLLFLQLITELDQIPKKTLTGFQYKGRITIDQGRRLQLVFDHAMNHFEKPIGLEEVSELVHMTPNAFCRFFKQRTNTTFFEFLVELRIEHACQLLLRDPGMAISEVAERSGFRSISNFNRKFRKLKRTTPSHYTLDNTL